MKKSILLLTLMSQFFTLSLNSQIKVNSSGYVGINNTSPSYQLDVSGTTRFVPTSGKSISVNVNGIIPTGSQISLGGAGNYWFKVCATWAYFTNDPIIQSDMKYKTNITEIAGMVDKVKLIRPVTYKLKADATDIGVDKTNIKTSYGFIAQELKEVFPDMVSVQPNDILGIHYTEMIPVLVQALKEQQLQIEVLTKRITDLESKIK